MEWCRKGVSYICKRLKTRCMLERMPAAEFDVDAARRQLDRVLCSAGFSRNERLARFLRFIVEQHLEGRDREIKESVIAVEVFGRRTDHDPKQDSIVRTEATRLRARLRDYYADEGKSDPLVIELPKGGYAPIVRQIPANSTSGTAAPAPSSRSRSLWLPIVLGIVAVSVVAIGLWRFERGKEPISIAVLPLSNVSQEPGNEYFADGLTDEIIRNLSIIDGLAVRSQTSSFVFKGKPRNIRDAGTQLGADYILEGSVLRSGNQLRINAQLVRVHDDFPLWSGRYDRELTDVVAIQDEISRGIVNSLRLKLGRGRRRYETSTEVYDLYLRAHALALEGGVRNLSGSIGVLEEVTTKDPSFAPAFGDLAGAYAARSGQFQFNIPDEVSKMRNAAEKAIQLDPLLAEAHYAQGMVYARDAKWKDSEQSFRRAIQIDPSRAESHSDFALFLLWPLGRIDEALRELRIAEKADPLSGGVHQGLANVLISAAQYNQAANQCEKMQEEPVWLLSRARLGQGRVGEAIQILEAELNRGVPAGNQAWGELGYAYARAGRREDAEKLAANSPSQNPFNQALIFAGLGDKDRTFEALDRAVSGGPFRMGRTLTWPELALLRGDPRVKVLRKKVGLPE